MVNPECYNRLWDLNRWPLHLHLESERPPTGKMFRSHVMSYMCKSASAQSPPKHQCYVTKLSYIYAHSLKLIQVKNTLRWESISWIECTPWEALADPLAARALAASCSAERSSWLHEPQDLSLTATHLTGPTRISRFLSCSSVFLNQGIISEFFENTC